jgi:hypothetical protein
MNESIYHLYITIILVLLLTACAQSPQSIQTAIAQTQAAWTATPTSTYTATFTPQPTSTSTPQQIPPTKTEEPKPTYILETGWCLFDAGDFGNVDPKTVQHYGINICQLEKREQIQIAPNFQVELTISNSETREVWCALFSLDGTFIMSDVDTIGSGKVICHP